MVHCASALAVRGWHKTAVVVSPTLQGADFGDAVVRHSSNVSIATVVG